MLFIDEIKFPLNQTARYQWIKKGETPAIKLNRRPTQDGMLTAIALCSTTQFLAVQIYQSEIQGKDFLNFLNTAIMGLPTDKSYLILADNATWHHASCVQSTKAHSFLLFNVPRMFYINMIENSFSGVRAEYRKRPLVESVERECELILKIFFAEHNQERFAGYYRNHLRMLLKYY